MDDQEPDERAESSDVCGAAPLPYFSPLRPLRRLSLEGAAVVACRALALWAGIQVLEALSYSTLMGIIALATSPFRNLHFSDFASQLMLLPRLVAFGTAGAVLWFKAGWLSERITRFVPARAVSENAAPGEDTTHLPRDPLGDAAPLLSILLMAAGAFVLADAMPELGRALSAPLYARGGDDTGGWLGSLLQSPDFWAAIIKCAIGAWLLLGSGGIARFVLKLRKGDQVPAAVDPANKADGPL